ncbi:MAG TPA: pyridoxamine 5'-phosphate oxidase family protein [Blastocatellia bacterium]|nr:pyridoxamine 5'-phosphate oxidase family protein [Blastocatellia bacterium]
MDSFAPTERTTLKRLPKRGAFDHETVYSILDEAFICHVGFSNDGQPFVIPTSFGRIDDLLYIHGSAASRMLRTLEGEVPVCITVTLIDGLVLARSAFHHSINYRSVVILGSAARVSDEEEKLRALRAISDHIIAGRWDDVRGPNEAELKATLVLRVPLREVSAKIRTGPPVDDDEDMSLQVWAGELPLRIVSGEPVADPQLPSEIEVPSYAAGYKRGCKV